MAGRGRLLGPLYHLTEAADCSQALAEAQRVLRPLRAELRGAARRGRFDELAGRVGAIDPITT